MPLVLLHGWGNDARVWNPLLERLCEQVEVIVVDLPGFGASRPCQSWHQVIDELAGALPTTFNLVGWSLGGMLAVQLAHRYPERVRGLVTLASNAVFVSRSGWKPAMGAAVFDDFYQQFVADPAGTLRQFVGLEARGDDSERQLLKWLRANSAEVVPGAWLAGLGWLKQLDNREALAGLRQPSLHLYGAGDQLVPAAAAAQVAKLSRSLRTRVLDGVGHAPHISRPGAIVAEVLGFLYPDSRPDKAPYHLQKARIAESFGRAAASYDAVADLQRQVGESLLAMVPDIPRPSAVADLGCGTGYFTPRLARRFAGATCTGIDLSPGMLSYAASHTGFEGSEGSVVEWLCGDAEALPVADGYFDLVYSNFTFQWCQDLDCLMAEQWRVLKPGGWLAFTTVGPESLKELRGAWQAVDAYVHVNQFSDLAAVRRALDSAGLVVEQWREASVVRHYDRLNGLTRELKDLGAHNLNSGRNSALTGRQRVAALKAAYESYRQPEGLPATWQMLYVVARKPEEDHG